MNDFALYVVTPIVVTLCSAYLVIGLVTYGRGRRPQVPQRVLAFFELGRDPGWNRPQIGIGLVFFAAILSAFEFAAGQSLIEAVRAGNIVSGFLWVVHFGVLLVWGAYLWRSA